MPGNWPSVRWYCPDDWFLQYIYD